MALSNEQKNKMWALLNQTRGQIGLTAYKDYIFGLLFYKYLSEKATQWLGEVLRGDTWENVYDPEEKLSEFKLEFFIQNGEMYERKTEFHYERAYSDREIKGMLKKAGLTLLAVYDDLTFDEPSPHSEKIFYIAKKEN